MTIIVIHSKTLDGFVCREIARRYFRYAHPDAAISFMGWSDGDPLIPFPSEQYIHLLDVSPECLDLSSFASRSPFPDPFDRIHELRRIIWIGHDGRAINFHAKGYRGYRLEGVACCRLAQQWFHMGEPVTKVQKASDFLEHKVQEPPVIRLIGEYIMQ